jgi:hypothetical protein
MESADRQRFRQMILNVSVPTWIMLPRGTLNFCPETPGVCRKLLAVRWKLLAPGSGSSPPGGKTDNGGLRDPVDGYEATGETKDETKRRGDGPTHFLSLVSLPSRTSLITRVFSSAHTRTEQTRFWAPPGLGPRRPPMFAMGQRRPCYQRSQYYFVARQKVDEMARVVSTR